MIIIGDVHGQLHQLGALLQQINHLYPDSPIVFAGDIPDRGHYSMECFDVVIALVRNGRARCIEGNHEEMFRDALDYARKTGKFPEAWLHGHSNGQSCIDSYAIAAQSVRHSDIVAEVDRRGHYRFLKEELVPFIETDDLLITHAPIPATAGPGWRSSAEALRWSFLAGHPESGFAMDHGKLAVCGHISSRFTPFVRRWQNQVYLDSGAGFGGPLSAVYVERGKVINTLSA